MSVDVLDPPAIAEKSLSLHAPLRIGRVSLIVRDLSKVSTYYQQVVGLTLLASSPTRHTLGAGQSALLDLIHDPAARHRSPREPGLFHTAFLLPSRADLARWIGHVARNRMPVVGASDHLVSEAIYLSDPEGNGVEIYADRPAKDWPRNGSQIEMPSDPLDVDAILRAGDARPWAGAPSRTIVGHIHLQVGAIGLAEQFYGAVMGFDLTHRVPGATFYGAGGYHHHIATNVWNSRNGERHDGGSTGLEGFEIIAANEAAYAAALQRIEKSGLTFDRQSLLDPWGTRITLVKA